MKLGAALGDNIEVTIPLGEGDPDKDTRGSTLVSKLLTIAFLLRLHDTAKALEIGTYMGIGSLWIAANLRDDGTCHTLDLPVDEGSKSEALRDGDKRLIEADVRSRRVFVDHPLHSRIVQHWGDSKTYNFSSLGSGFGFVYVDGEHSLEAIAIDTANALGILGDDGFIVWDDYLPFHLGSHPGVREFINWFNESVDQVYDIGGQAVWFARLSSFTPADLADKYDRLVRRKWPHIFGRSPRD